jgi:glutamyl-tRNA synthetase
VTHYDGVHSSASRAQPEWSADGTRLVYLQSSGAKLGAIAQPLRVALTGRTTSPGIFDVLAVLGKAESLARIGDQAVGPAEGLSAAR